MGQQGTASGQGMAPGFGGGQSQLGQKMQGGQGRPTNLYGQAGVGGQQTGMTDPNAPRPNAIMGASQQGAVPPGAAPGVQYGSGVNNAAPLGALQSSLLGMLSGQGGNAAQDQARAEQARTLQGGTLAPGATPGGNVMAPGTGLIASTQAPAVPGTMPTPLATATDPNQLTTATTPAPNPNATLSPSGLPGGSALPAAYQTPVGPVEDYLHRLGLQGASAFNPVGNFQNFQAMSGASPAFLQSLAAGQVPQATMQQFQNEQARQQAQLAEQFGGARFGTDYMGALGRQQGQALTNLMAQSEQNAGGAYGALQQPLNTWAGLQGQAQNQWGNVQQALLQSETARQQGAMNAMGQDYGGQSGLPPEMSALMGLLGIGGGETAGRGTAGKFL